MPIAARVSRFVCCQVLRIPTLYPPFRLIRPRRSRPTREDDFHQSIRMKTTCLPAYSAGLGSTSSHRTAFCPPGILRRRAGCGGRGTTSKVMIGLVLAVMVLAVRLEASITSISLSSFAGVQHNDTSSNPIDVFSQTTNAFPLTLYSPLTVTTVGTMNYQTEASLQGAATVSTSTTYQLDTFFAGDATTYGTANPPAYSGNSTIALNIMVTFTLDAPGTITFNSYNSLFQGSTGSNWATAGGGKLFWLDNTLVHSSYSDATYVIPVSAGSYFVQVYEEIKPSFIAGPPPSDFATVYATSRTKVLIESVPEPGSFLLAVLSLAGLAWRRGRGTRSLA